MKHQLRRTASGEPDHPQLSTDWYMAKANPFNEAYSKRTFFPSTFSYYSPTTQSASYYSDATLPPRTLPRYYSPTTSQINSCSSDATAGSLPFLPHYNYSPYNGIVSTVLPLQTGNFSDTLPNFQNYFGKGLNSATTSQFGPYPNNGPFPPSRVEESAVMPGTPGSSGHISYSPAPPDTTVNTDVSTASTSVSTNTTTTNVYHWPKCFQIPSNETSPSQHHHAVSFDTPKLKLTSEVAAPLIEWFEEHRDHPYPSRKDKITLCQVTGLTFTQLSTWFANARRRMKKHSTQDESQIALSPSKVLHGEWCRSGRPSSSDDSDIVSPL